MGPTNGTNIRIIVDGDPIAYATSCTLEYSGETRSTVSKDSQGNGWATVEMGELSASITLDSLFTEDTTVNSADRLNQHDLFDIFSGKQEITWEFTDSETGHYKYSGNGFFTSGSTTAGAEENTTNSHTITVNGAVNKSLIA